jgi:ankyrin repeat protein
VENGTVSDLEALLQSGADPETTDEEGRTPLSIAAGLGETAKVRVLLQHGANADAVDHENLTPLHYACDTENLDIVHQLLDAGVDVNATNDDGVTPLHFACDKDPSLVNVLLDRGATVNVENEDGTTPVHDAATSGSVDNVRLLMIAGANMPADFDCLLSEVRDSGHAEMVPWLEYATDFSPLHFACEARNDDIVLNLLRSDATMEELRTHLGPCGPSGLTALELASTGPDQVALCLPQSPNLITMLQAVHLSWSPTRNRFWPRAFRAGVRTILRIHHRLRHGEEHQDLAASRIEENLWLHILSFAGRDWFQPSAAAASFPLLVHA